MTPLILGQGVSKRLGPVVNIITRFNIFRPSAYFPLCDEREWGRRVHPWNQDFLLIGYRHVIPNAAWGKTISKEEGLQLLFDDLLELESKLNQRLCLFHTKHYLLRAAVISRAFHEGNDFFHGEMARAMKCAPDSRFAFDATFYFSDFLYERIYAGWGNFSNREKELRRAELDLVELFDRLRVFREKAERDARRASQLKELHAKRLATRRPRRKLAEVAA